MPIYCVADCQTENLAKGQKKANNMDKDNISMTLLNIVQIGYETRVLNVAVS